MSKRTSTGLAVLAALAAIAALLAWKWPRRDAPQTPAALVRLAVEALRTGDLERFRAASPLEGELQWAAQQLDGLLLPSGDREVWEWVAAHGSGMPVVPRPFRTDEEVFEVLRSVAPTRLVGGDATFVGLDSEVDPPAVESGLRTSDIRFRVACEGAEHRFLAKGCFWCPRGWVCLEGLHYEGPASGGALGAVAPGSLVFRFSFDFEGTEAIVANVRWATTYWLRDRLRRSTFRGAYMVGSVEDTFEVVLPGSYEDRRDEFIALMTRLGSLVLRIEVLPDAEYLKLAGTGVRRARLTLWKGTAAEFHAFKAAEIAVWRKAHEEGVSYVPSTSGLLLVKTVGTDGSQVEHFHLLEDPATVRNPLDDVGCFEPPEVAADPLGNPILVFRVKPAWRAPLWRWSRDNQGLPLAIVVEGEYLMAPIITTPLHLIQLNLGPGTTREEALRKAMALAPLLGGRGLPHAPKFEGVTRK